MSAPPPLCPDRIAGIVLAGGRGSRMGGADKALLALHGRSLLAHVIQRLGCARAISANGDPARFATFGLPVLADRAADYPGPLAGIAAGLDWAAEAGFAAIVTAAADTPFFPPDLAGRLAQAAGQAGAAVAMAAGRSDDAPGVARQPTFALWRTSLAAVISADLAAGERRPGAVAARHGCVTVEFCAPAAFFNINTPADLAAARDIPPSFDQFRLEA